MALIGIILYLITRGQFFISDYIINNDASQHLIWLNVNADYALEDETITFSRLIQPYGVKFGYETLNYFLTVKESILVFDFIRCLLLFFIVRGIYRRLFDTKLSNLLIFSSLYVTVILIGNIGLPRSFASLFVMGSVYIELYQGYKSIKRGMNMLLASLFYPPAFFIVFLFTVIYNAIKIQKNLFPINKPKIKQGIIYFTFLGFSIALLLLQKKQITSHHLAGHMVNMKTIMSDPLYDEHGRVHLKIFWSDPFNTFLHKISALNEYLVPSVVRINPTTEIIMGLLLLSFSLMYSIIFKKHHISALIFSGITLYWLAIVFPLKLFIPDRFLLYTIVLGGVFFLSHLFVHKFKYGIYRWSFSGLAFFLLLCVTFNGLQYKINNYSCNKLLYESVKKNTKKKSMLICNNLQITDMIPFFTNRSVFTSYENLHAVYFTAYKEIQDEKMAARNLIFGSNNEFSVENALKENSIDYLLLEEPFFSITDDFELLPYSFNVKMGSGLKKLLKVRQPIDSISVNGRIWKLYELQFLY